MVTRDDIRALVDLTVAVAKKYQENKAVTRGDVAMLSMWDEIWQHMSDDDQEHIAPE